MNRSIFVAVAVVILLAVAFAWWIAGGPAIRQLLSADKSDRPEILAALVEKNGLRDFPPKFSLASEEAWVDCQEFADGRGNILVLATAWYPVGPGGNRGHTFVFDLPLP